jgi:hypothetical protein
MGKGFSRRKNNHHTNQAQVFMHLPGMRQRREPLSEVSSKRNSPRDYASRVGPAAERVHLVIQVRIPMMSISHSDLMPIRAERSDAGLSQCEVVIDIRQEFCWFSLS